MASQALNTKTNKSAFIDACALADVDAAAARHRGLEVNVEGVSLSLYRARDGALTCIETACHTPATMRRLAADPGDIEDLLRALVSTCRALHRRDEEARAGILRRRAGRCVVSRRASASDSVLYQPKRAGTGRCRGPEQRRRHARRARAG